MRNNHQCGSKYRNDVVDVTTTVLERYQSVSGAVLLNDFSSWVIYAVFGKTQLVDNGEVA